MKKMLILVAVVSLVVGAVFAEEAILIDFGLLSADTHVGNNPRNYPGDDNTNDQNQRTIMDFNRVHFTGSFTDEQQKSMKTSFAIQNWEVILSSSSRTPTNMVLSYTKETKSKQFGTVMGVRAHFPIENFNASALIKPPFEVPAYEPINEENDTTDVSDTKTKFEEGYGLLKNVGTIKSIAVNVYGLYFPYGLWTNLIFDDGSTKSLYMGNLNFDGWGELRWDNPAYIQEVRNRDLRLVPLYPDTMPFIKFDGFLIKRNAEQVGGDFITYFKDVRVIYDKAVLDSDRDIDDEATWKIIEARETARKLWQMERFGEVQVLRFMDFQRQAVEGPEFQKPAKNDQQ
jgi:hypothetical protein